MQDQILFFQSLRKTPAITPTEALLTTAKGMERSLTKLLLFSVFPAGFCFFLSLYCMLPKAQASLSGCLSRLCLVSGSANIPKRALNSSHPSSIAPAQPSAHPLNELGCSTSAGQGLDKPALFCVVHYRCILKPPVNTSNNRMRLLTVHSQMVIQTFTYLLGILIISTE